MSESRNAYDLSPESKKIIGRFSRDQFYVYIRPTTSLFAEPSKKEGQWWVVSVQIRAMPPREFRGEGRVLDEVIRKMGQEVPRRKDLDTYKPITDIRNDHIGFLAPARLWNEKFASIMEDGSELLKRAMKDGKEARKAGKPFENYGEIPPPKPPKPAKGKKSKKGKK